MKKLILSMTLGILCIPGVQSQLPFKSDVRSQGMGDIGVILRDHWSGVDNPACLSFINEIQTGIYHSNYYGLAETSLSAFYSILPAGTGNFGVSYMTFGYSLYRHNNVVLGYGRKLCNWLSAGIGMHYLWVRQPDNYPTFFMIVPSLGIHIEIVKGLTTGLYIFNPAGQNYKPNGNKESPVFCKGGFGYHLGKEMIITLEIEGLSNENPVIVRGGMEFSIKDKFMIRYGLCSSSLTEFMLGAGFRRRNLATDFAVRYHPILGTSPALGLSYAFHARHIK